MDPTFRLTGSPQPTTKRRIDLSGPDYYPTPIWATEALLLNETFEGAILEPCCGDGAMAKVFVDAGHHVIASDLYDRGYGKSGVDFFKETGVVSNIVTNPPFHSAEEAVKVGVRCTSKKLCLLMRLAFLESAHRYELFQKHPPSRIWVFSERVTFYPANDLRTSGGTTAYGWYIWDKSYSGPTVLNWIKPRIKKGKR